MAWELRIFFPLGERSFNLWSYLAQTNKNFKLDKHIIEERTDTYFNLHDKRYGLKLRDKKLLELKVLGGVDEGGLEKWTKTVVAPLNHKQNDNYVKSLSATLKPYRETDTVISLLSNKFQEENDVLDVKKRRIQIMYDFSSTLKVEGQNQIMVEQTDFDVCRIVAGKEEILGAFRSICVENAPDKKLMRKVIEDICTHVDGYSVEGYPEFISRF